MKKSIMGGLLVFIFTFMAVFLALDNRQETYALQDGGSGGGVATSPDSRFPDINFYNCLKDSGVGIKNGKITDFSLRTTTVINCPRKNINYATGIELFPNLISIDLRGNKLNKINLGKKYALQNLYLSNNNLTTIDLGKTAVLIRVDLSNNKLTSIKNFDSKGILNQGINLLNNNFASIPQCCINNPSSCLFGVIVKFDLNGGTGSVSSQNIAFEGKVIKPSNPSRSGYDFQCWAYNDNCWNFDNYTSQSQYSSLNPNSSTWPTFTLKAKWKVKSNNGGGNNGGNNNSNNCDGKLVKLVFDCGKQKNCQKPSDYSVCKHKGTDYTKIYFKKTDEHNALIASKTGYDFLYWLSKDGKRRYSPTCKDSNGKSIKDCKTSISISKKNTLTAVWQKEKASESEVVSTSKNVFMRMMMVIVALFVAAGFGVLSYSYLHAGPSVSSKKESIKKTTKKSSKK